jgi:hypothetical protein
MVDAIPKTVFNDVGRYLSPVLPLNASTSNRVDVSLVKDHQINDDPGPFLKIAEQ